MATGKNTNWDEWRELVLFRLQEQGEQIKLLQEEVRQNSLEINSFRASARTSGTIAGLVGSILFFIIDKLWKGQ